MSEISFIDDFNEQGVFQRLTSACHETLSQWRFRGRFRGRETAKKVLIPRDSVHYIIAKYKSTKCIGNLMGRGRIRKTSAHTDRILQQKVKTNLRKSAAAVKAELESELKIIVSESTVRRRLHEVGLYGRVARKIPY